MFAMSVGNEDARAAALAAAARHGLAPGSALRLLNRSENTTFAHTDVDGQRSVLRVHRPGYHRRAQIESELDWLAALRGDGEVAVPAVLATPDGRRVVDVDTPAGRRQVVRFAFVDGAHPDAGAQTIEEFATLGRITAALHDHAQRWRRPASFDRFVWDWRHCLGDDPRWGRWEQAPGVSAHDRAVLTRVAGLLARRLADYGDGPDRFGLVHADLRAANLLIDDGEVTVIDFDDSGFGWLLYDFGAAVSFVEDSPELGDWQQAWVDGYRSRRELSTADEGMLASFVLLRRLLLLAWMGTHGHADEARALLADYATGSVELAERYLGSDGRQL
ncbi:hypothetical protein MBRU_02425 [Mycolicibacterium brumae DSM 44177]|nr:hypothetical protein MBRU_02425 [Mycolicibacterium brumae DSM 44177]